MITLVGVTEGAVAPMDGKTAKAARQRLGLTQFQVAVELGISPQHVSNYERGISRLSPRVEWRLAQLLGLPAGEEPAVPAESRLEVLQAQMESLKSQMDGLESLVRRVLEATQRERADGQA